MTKLIPMGENVLVQPISEETSSIAGIVLPDSKEKPGCGTVIAVGWGRLMDNGSTAPIMVKEWDVVYFTKYSPDEVEVEGQKYLIIKASSILAKRA